MLISAPPLRLSSLVALALACAACAQTTEGAPPKTLSIAASPDEPAPAAAPAGPALAASGEPGCPGSMVLVRGTGSLGAFCLDRTEVTVDAYRACVAAGACAAPASRAEAAWFSNEAEREFWGSYCNARRSDRGAHPMNCVDWAEASAYCAWRGARLPTSDEWEFAARGGETPDTRPYPWGAAPPDATRLNACGTECRDALAQRGKPWGAMHAQSDGWPDTAPVGSFPDGAAPSGALDMAGNVWEWTTTGAPPRPGDGRPYRGRGWADADAQAARSLLRGEGPPAMRVPDLGLRCAKPAR